MGQRITIKVRFNASREKFESFGNGMYLAYLTFPQDDSTVHVLGTLISRHLGASLGRIEFAGVDKNTNWVFELT